MRGVRGALEQVSERETDLGDEHHAIHVGPGHVVFFDREILRSAEHQVAHVITRTPSLPARAICSRMKLPVRMPDQAPMAIMTNGTTNDGEIIQAARRTP